MSIPGLGQIPTQAPPSATRTHQLQKLWEYRFDVGPEPITLRLLSGRGERDGTELAVNQPYAFSNIKSKINTWHGCRLEVTGVCDEYVAEQGDETPLVSYLNAHFLLDAERVQAAGRHAVGPRVLVCGPPSSGRSSLVRMLAAWAVRMGRQPVVVNAEPKEGLLSLPGTLSSAVFATVMDVESEGGGWGTAPSSGPSAVPVKLPLVHYYGREKAEDDVELYKTLVGRLAGAVMTRLTDDPEVRSSGLLIDAPAVGLTSKTGMDVLADIIEEFSVNTILVLGWARLNQELMRRFGNERTSLGEDIRIVMLDRSDGVVARERDALQQAGEAVIKEYFFGNSKRTLSPSTQQVDFDSLAIYREPDPFSYTDEGMDSKNTMPTGLQKLDVSASISHWTLAIMNASLRDPPEVIRAATVIGFVYVADADEERRKLRILSPVSGRLGDRPMIWGRWPEPFINLLG